MFIETFYPMIFFKSACCASGIFHVWVKFKELLPKLAKSGLYTDFNIPHPKIKAKVIKAGTLYKEKVKENPTDNICKSC